LVARDHLKRENDESVHNTENNGAIRRGLEPLYLHFFGYAMVEREQRNDKKNPAKIDKLG
jgi:hypothetical protein